MSPRFAEVVLPLPLATSYTYRIPDELGPRVQLGSRVVVPVRRRTLTGIVVAVDVSAPKVTARDIEAALDSEPSVPAPLLELARWMSGYYGAPIGLAVKLLVPTALWGTSSGAGERTERVLSLAPERLTLVERDERFRRRPKQRALYETVEALGGSAPVRHLMEQLGFGDGVIRALARSGAATIEQSEHLRDPFAGVAGTPPPERVTAAQEQALTGIAALGAGEGALLLGVTGSGKTLVYLEAVRRELAAGRGAIVLVPEIGLTPQAVSRFRGAFGDQVAVLHSALSDGERADAWRLLRRGERRVAVGARSAVLAPVANLGLIVIDEEHEATYKNGEAPRYHAREVAGVRARIEGARLLLGSATPSLETVARTSLGADDPRALVRFDLPDRIESRPLPPVELVDLRKAPLVHGTGSVAWSVALDDAIGSALSRGEQAILLLNRRGFAAYLQCPDCGSVRHCPDCTISLTVHQTPAALRCHYCGHEEPVPTECPECGGAVQRMRGVGTQQLERLVAERFPDARIGRMDLDTTSTKWSHQRILEAVERRDIDILIGTQMIAKGLDFPNVTLVGVVDADTGLNLPDFRAAERSFQLLAQVGGRAGRGPRGGKVLVQTRCPDHHALVHASTHDTEGFLAAELALRESPPAPPVLALVNLVVSGLNEIEVGATAARVADWCQRIIDRHDLAVSVLGPAPCPVARIKERWRWHAVLRGPSRELGRIVRTAARSLARRGREPAIVIDRDPVSML